MKLVFTVAFATVCLLAGLVFSSVPYANAQMLPGLRSPYVTFGMVSLAAGQSARINAYLLPMGGPIIAGASCQVTFSIVNDQGATVAANTVPVNPNQAVHFDYPAPLATSVEIRGTVRTAFSDPSASPVAVNRTCVVIPTMEIIEQSTGRTALLLENTHPLPEVLPLSVTP